MASYKRIKKEEGIKYFPFIGTVFVSNDKDLWANPFENKHLRKRCFFKIIDEKTMEIFFHLTRDEFYRDVEILALPCEIYFSGAYNQINVCQMRAFGKLNVLTNPADINEFRDRLKADLEKRTNNTKVSLMNEVTTKEKLKALEIVSGNDSMFFRFVPMSYASHVYEIG